MSKRGNGEGSIYKRGDGRWSGALSIEGGRRRYVYSTTRAETAEKLRRLRQQIAQGDPLAHERTTVAAFLSRWLEESAVSRVRPRTLKGYREQVNLHIVPAIGKVRLRQLTPEHVERMMAGAVASGRSARSVAHDRAVLRTALNVAMKWGLVGRNVAALADPPRISEPEFHALTVESARSVLAAVAGDRLEALYQVSLVLGLRQGEALGLQWDDLDLTANTLSVQRGLQRYEGAFHLDEPKTARSRRSVPIPEPVAAALREHRARQLEERLQAGPAWEGGAWGDLVFCSDSGTPLHGSSVTKRFKRLLVDAGIEPLHYHGLRHGAATLLAAQGVPPRVAMEILGHAQISTTMNIYAHVAPELQREATDRVAEAIFGG